MIDRRRQEAILRTANVPRDAWPAYAHAAYVLQGCGWTFENALGTMCAMVIAGRFMADEALDSRGADG